MRILSKISIILLLIVMLTLALQFISSEENSIDLTNRNPSGWGLVSDNPIISLR